MHCTYPSPRCNSLCFAMTVYSSSIQLYKKQLKDNFVSSNSPGLTLTNDDANKRGGKIATHMVVCTCTKTNYTLHTHTRTGCSTASMCPRPAELTNSFRRFSENTANWPTLKSSATTSDLLEEHNIFHR